MLFVSYFIDSDDNNSPRIESKEEAAKRKNPKEVVFLDEEISSPSPVSSDSNDNNSELEDPLSPHSSPEYSVPHANEPDMSANESDQNSSSDKLQSNGFSEEEERGDNSEEEKEEASPPPEEEYNLEDAANYFHRQNGDVICHRCGNTGHIASNCPLGPSREPCIQCASVQHQVKNCPTNICRQYSLLLPHSL